MYRIISMSCKIFFSKFLKRIGLLWIFLFFSFAYSQDIIEISQLNAINVPAAAPPSPIALSATCPTSSYELGVTIRNNSGAPINFAATSLNISLTLTGVNAQATNTIISSGTDLIIDRLIDCINGKLSNTHILFKF